MFESLISSLMLKKIEDIHGSELTQLRHRAYVQKYGEAVDLTALNWNPRLAHTYNLGLWNQERLISAYRIDLLKDHQQIRFALQISDQKSWTLPVFLGCRACTDPAYQNRRLHFILRAFSIRLIMKTNVEFLVSTFESTNPWQSTLRKAGYQIQKSGEGWDDFLSPISSPQIASLNLKSDGEIAAATLEATIQSFYKRNLNEIVDYKVIESDFLDWFHQII